MPNRSADIFADLLRFLQGYPVSVRDEAHRADLLRDARYFHLKGLEQRLLPCETSYNLARERSEVLIRLEDIRQSGLSFVPDDSPNLSTDPSVKSSTASSTPSSAAPILAPPYRGWIHYARPFVDDSAYFLVMEISGSTESTKLDLQSMRASFSGHTKARIASLFQVVANKMNLPVTQPLGLMMMETGGGVAAQPVSLANSGISGDTVRVSIGRDAWVVVDGAVGEWDGDEDIDEGKGMPPLRVGGVLVATTQWVIHKGQWRLRVRSMDGDPERVEVVLCAVRLEAFTEERTRNGRRGFLI